MAKRKTRNRQADTKKDLRKKDRVYKIPSVRDVISKQMKSQKVSVYRLAQLSGVIEQTVRNFVKGGREIRSDKLQLLMEALGLEIRPTENRTK